METEKHHSYAWVPFAIAIITILGALATNYYNENQKRVHEDYIRKEQKYSKLLYSLTGFHSSQYSYDLQAQFVEELRQCYLYCSDDVIRNANKFLNATSIQATSEERERAQEYYKTLILSIRNDLIRRERVAKSSLTSDDIFLFNPMMKKQQP